MGKKNGMSKKAEKKAKKSTRKRVENGDGKKTTVVGGNIEASLLSTIIVNPEKERRKIKLAREAVKSDW
jgi:hypothetical protein